MQPDSAVSLIVLALALNMTGRWACQHQSELDSKAVSIGMTAFLILLGAAIINQGSLAGVTVHVLRSALFAWCLTGFVRLLLPTLMNLFRHLVQRPWNALWRVTCSVFRAAATGTASRYDSRLQQRRNREQHSEHQHVVRAEQQRQREDEIRNQIRFELQLLYDRYRVQLSAGFPEERLAAQFNEYLPENLALGVYQERAEQLRRVILQHAGQDSEPQKSVSDSPETILATFEQRLEQIKSLDLDEDTFDVLETDLNREREEQLREHFRRQRTKGPLS